MPVAGVTEQLHYIGDKALFVKKLGADHHEYLHRDHIGSIVAISSDSLNSSADAQFLSNGAWGERRMAQWNGPLDPGVIPSSTAHGFTDHEHLDAVGLIHMKGRVYDPELGRFLSADPMVQAPYNSQSYNRYAYVFNNPLSFTDPSGYCTSTTNTMIGWTKGSSVPPSILSQDTTLSGGGCGGGDSDTAGGGGEQTVDLSSVREFIPEVTGTITAVEGNQFLGLLTMLSGDILHEDDEFQDEANKDAFTAEFGKVATAFVKAAPYAYGVGEVRALRELLKGGGKGAGGALQYDSRVRARGVQDPVSHNFPYSFDKKILSTKPEVKDSGYQIFRLEGTMTGKVVTDSDGRRIQQYKEGVFEIGVTIQGIIDHRFFRPY